MQYFQAVNTGYGFITHEDNERSYIANYPGDLWLTEYNQIWADRVGAVEKTRVEAQIICDNGVTALIENWELCNSIAGDPSICGPKPEYIILPDYVSRP